MSVVVVAGQRCKVEKSCLAPFFFGTNSRNETKQSRKKGNFLLGVELSLGL